MRFLFLLLSFIAIRAYAKIEVIDTTRQAETLLPMVRGILNAESTVQAYQQQLIIHASADEIAQVKNLLARIDKIGRTLMITVKKESSSASQNPFVGQNKQGFGSQTLRTTEGSNSFISMGQSRFYVTGQNQGDWKNAHSGFYVTPYVNQQRVTLSIAQEDSRFKEKNIEQQALRSTVNGQLGQWILVGEIQENAQQNYSNVLELKHGTQQKVYLKVELVP